MSDTQQSPPPRTQAPEANTTVAHQLDHQSIGLPSVTAQSAALIAPAGAAAASMAFIASFAGGASPLAFLIGFIAVLLLGIVIGAYARRLPSAGAFYTYITRTFGPKAGFVTGVLQFGTYLLFMLFQLSFFGSFVSSLVPHVPWQVWSIALIVFTTTLGFFGIKPSLQSGLIGLAFEMTVFGTLALVVIFHGGAHGNTFEVFNPSSSLTGSSGIFTAVVYTLFAFAGFESSTALGDEARNARRTIPRSIILTAVVVGLFYILVSYAVVVGFGNTDAGIKALVNSSDPFGALASRYGNGFLEVLTNIAVVTSLVALNIVTMVAISRIFWKMGTDRLLPPVLGKVNRYRAPGIACIATGVAMGAVCLIAGSIWGAFNFASWMSYFGTLFMIVAYMLIALGVPVYMWRSARTGFNWFIHAVLPLVSLAAMVWVLKGNVIPYPPAPLRWFIYATIAAIIAAWAVAVRLARVNPHAMRQAGAVLGEVEEQAVLAEGDEVAEQAVLAEGEW